MGVWLQDSKLFRFTFPCKGEKISTNKKERREIRDLAERESFPYFLCAKGSEGKETKITGCYFVGECIDR